MQQNRRCPVTILLFFTVHWQLSVFYQSFFQHRYCAHRQFTMTPRMERFFHLLSYVVLGASYLAPRDYAILHREHHAYADTPDDSHSPDFHPNALRMMQATLKRYAGHKRRQVIPEPRFEGGYPELPWLDRFGQTWVSRTAWMIVYGLIYARYATTPWLYALLPIHCLFGTVHGAIVNWCGHRYGYRTFATGDSSRNTLVFDVFTAGELFQNNHHWASMSPNFAARPHEIDPGYQALRVLHALRLIDLSGSTLIPSPDELAKGRS
jgi:stearoyl-CoA desaturase (delta-9 desaturase)